jgi:hypothetical protein
LIRRFPTGRRRGLARRGIRMSGRRLRLTFWGVRECGFR